MHVCNFSTYQNLLSNQISFPIKCIIQYNIHFVIICEYNQKLLYIEK